MTINFILNLLLTAAIAANVLAFIRTIKVSREAEAAFDEAADFLKGVNERLCKVVEEIQEPVRPQVHIVHLINEDKSSVKVNDTEIKEDKKTEEER